MYTKNNSGPDTDPCVTSDVTFNYLLCSIFQEVLSPLKMGTEQILDIDEKTCFI